MLTKCLRIWSIGIDYLFTDRSIDSKKGIEWNCELIRLEKMKKNPHRLSHGDLKGVITNSSPITRLQFVTIFNNLFVMTY